MQVCHSFCQTNGFGRHCRLVTVVSFNTFTSTLMVYKDMVDLHADLASASQHCGIKKEWKAMYCSYSLYKVGHKALFIQSGTESSQFKHISCQY